MDKQRVDALRKQTEESIGAADKDFSGGLGNELRSALHELRTYQIELELQNEELRRVQEELVAVRDQYVDLYDFAPIGYVTISDKKLIVEANLTMADLLGEERNSLQGQPLSRFIFAEDQDIFSNCYDNTESKYLESEIIKANKLEATALLAGGIAHDFNNLLTIILGNLDLAEEDMRRGHPCANEMENARQACRSAAKLTRLFLTFASGGDPVPKLTSIEPLITYSTHLALAGSNVDFACSFPDDLWPVEVDADQITLAIGHVISNAKESMPGGGMIRIHAENTDSIPGEDLELSSDGKVMYIKILIQDEGVGIPEDILSQVFDPYFTSKQECHTKKGLGLGLTVTHSIIKKHGGSIDIVSQQDKGTTVTIYLPASEKQIVQLASEPLKALPVAKKILVMDDEEMLLKVTRTVLERLGYEVEGACNGEDAIHLYTKALRSDMPFGAVLLDLTIKGGMGGKETVKRLKKLDPNARAIVASGYSNDPVMANFREYDFDYALQKPYLLGDLKKALGEAVEITAEP